MTCAIGYSSELARNCIANPPWGEGCEICVKWNLIPLWIILGLVIVVSVIFVILFKNKQRRRNE